MSRLRPRGTMPGPHADARPGLMFALLFAVSVGGCSARSEYGPGATARVAVTPSYVAAAQSPAASPPEMEADGLPVQRPPLLHRTKRPDDPTEPFSPNYGASAMRSAETSYPAAVATVQRVSVRDLPEDLPPDFRERLIVANGVN